MGYLKLVATLIFFTTTFTLFGIASAFDCSGNGWGGAGVGGLIGIFFGLAVGGALDGTRLLDAVYPPGNVLDDEVAGGER
jgi:hypothetical protein